MNLKHLPNAITLARIGMVGPIGWLLHRQEYLPALLLMLVAGLSDALDGLLAKRFGWESRLGGLLDPIADKLLLAVGFIGLWSSGVLPGWLLALVLGRDLVIVAGALAWQLLIGPLQPQPSLLSKATTAVQIGFLLVVLGQLASGWSLSALFGLALWMVVGLTVASGVDYMLRWSLRALAVRRGVQS